MRMAWMLALSSRKSCLSPPILTYLPDVYSSIAIEGGIGAGKTTFATWLAEELGAE